MMEPFISHEGLVAPLDRSNVDTDVIIPKQFLKSVKRTGFGDNLFDSLRYLDEGSPGQDCSKRPLNTDFVLNEERYRGASILLTRANFGCGSSREHAPWALLGYGFRCVIAPSFADIFYNNCFKNGLLPVVLTQSQVDDLFASVAHNRGYRLTVDLSAQDVITPEGNCLHFEIDASYKHGLLKGLDEIGLTLEECSAKISAFEAEHRQRYPWLFDAPKA